MLLLILAISKINNDVYFLLFLIPLYVIMIFQNDHAYYGLIGILTAVIVGYIFEKKYIELQYTTSKKFNILRVVCGYPPALALFSIRYFLLANVHILLDYFIMFLIGVYLVILAPLIFKKLKFL